MTSSRKYVLKIRVFAFVMLLTLLFGTGISMLSLGLSGLFSWLVIWVAYFLIGWLLNPFQAMMFRRHDADEPSDLHLGQDQTITFLFWPILLIMTAIYIPLVLLLRRIFRAGSN